MKQLIIAVDFDGTIVEHAYPKIGEPIPYAIETLRWFQTLGHKLILWTCRTEDKLRDAVRYLNDRHIFLDEINENLPEVIDYYGPGRKVHADVYIDDRAMGCPKLPDNNVDWDAIRTIMAWIARADER